MEKEYFGNQIRDNLDTDKILNITFKISFYSLPCCFKSLYDFFKGLVHTKMNPVPRSVIDVMILSKMVEDVTQGDELLNKFMLFWSSLRSKS